MQSECKDQEAKAGQVYMSNDPWEHRSEKMRCQTCMWYAPKKTPMRPKTLLGRCRRHAPTVNGYPVVFVSDWCGDHKVDENKI